MEGHGPRGVWHSLGCLYVGAGSENHSHQQESVPPGHGQEKLALSSAESSLFVEKVSHCITYILRKLSNAGSGKYLPDIVRKVERTWKRYHSREKAGSKVGSKRLSKEMSQESLPTGSDAQDCWAYT